MEACLSLETVVFLHGSNSWGRGRGASVLISCMAVVLVGERERREREGEEALRKRAGGGGLLGLEDRQRDTARASPFFGRCWKDRSLWLGVTRVPVQTNRS